MSTVVDLLVRLLPLSHTDATVLLGSALVGALAGLVGSLAVLRQRSMVGDAVSHCALPGVCAAFLLAGGRVPWAITLGALVAGLLGALAMVGIERRGRVPQDAATGVVLTIGFSLGIVGLTWISNRAGADQAGLDTFLFGQAAALLERDLVTTSVLALLASATVLVLLAPLRTTLFDREFAHSVGLRATMVDVVATVLLVVAAVAGLQVVGAILMVSLLVAPPLVARQLVTRFGPMLLVAALAGAVIGAAGSLGASAIAAPTGPVIVLVGTAAAIAAVLLAPRRGLAWRGRRASRESPA